MLVLRAAGVLALAISVLSAQPAAGPTKPFPLSTIEVTGNENFTDEQIIGMSGLQTGQPVTKAAFDEAQQKLLDTGLFETIAYKYQPVGGGSYSATLEVKEIQSLYPYGFEAIAADEKELRTWLRQKIPLHGERLPPTEPVLNEFSEAIEAWFAKDGHKIDVIGRLLPVGRNNELEIVFQPSSLPSVAEVEFKGNSVLPIQTLQQAVAGAAVGTVFTEDRFRRVLDASVRPLYEAEGRLRVAFPKIETRPAQGVNGLVVTVHVEEGEPYKLAGVRIGGPMATDASLLKQGAFRTGDVVNMAAVEEGTDRIEQSLKRRGYLSARSVVERKMNDEEKTVSLVVEVDPGPQYRMGTLTIEGLDIQTEPHIRKLWAIQPNQPFDAEYPDLFVAKMPEYLDNLGKTRAAVNPDPGTHKVDVVVIFSSPEKKPEKPKI